MKKKLVSLVLASCMVVSLAACGETGADTATQPADGGQATESAPAADNTQADATAAEPVGEQVINVCLASEPATLDPALNSAVFGATMIIHLL